MPNNKRTGSSIDKTKIITQLLVLLGIILPAICTFFGILLPEIRKPVSDVIIEATIDAQRTLDIVSTSLSLSATALLASPPPPTLAPTQMHTEAPTATHPTTPDPLVASQTPNIPVDNGATLVMQAASTLTANYLQMENVAATATMNAHLRNINSTATEIVNAMTQDALNVMATETSKAMFATRTQLSVGFTTNAPIGTNANSTALPIVPSHYPCSATISRSFTSVIYEVRPINNPNASPSNRRPINAGEAIEVLSPATESANPLFRILDAQEREGWIPTRYVILSAACPE